jgi:hypothetical protein
MSSLTFPSKHSATVDGGVDFPAQDGEKHVRCRVSNEALHDHCGLKGGTLGGAKRAFEAHRALIENVASQKHARHEVEPDGSVLVKSSDVDDVLVPRQAQAH